MQAIWRAAARRSRPGGDFGADILSTLPPPVALKAVPVLNAPSQGGNAASSGQDEAEFESGYGLAGRHMAGGRSGGGATAGTPSFGPWHGIRRAPAMGQERAAIPRLRGRAPRGERLIGTVPFGRWHSQTFIASLTCLRHLDRDPARPLPGPRNCGHPRQPLGPPQPARRRTAQGQGLLVAAAARLQPRPQPHRDGLRLKAHLRRHLRRCHRCPR